MLYPKNIEKKIGFDKVRQLLEERCLSELGISYVGKMRFSKDASLIQKLISQTEEMVRIITHDTGFPSQGYISPKGALQKAKIENTFLTEDEFFDIKTSLNTIVECISFLSQEESEQYRYMQELAQQVEVDPHFVLRLQSVIDDNGKIKDNASPTLAEIRRKVRSVESSLDKTIHSILKTAKDQGFADPKAGITIRGGRIVIPIIASHKRKIKGFVHDESDTGQTVYLEPAEVLDKNNEIRELQNHERREIVKILTALTDQLRPLLPFIKRAFNFLGMVDFIRAKALLALDLEACQPQLKDTPFVDWRNAVHPLLYLTHRAQGKTVVPVSLNLEPNKRILVISGPNAGGKSITLKTLALVQYMVQCGLMPPMSEGSTVGIFDDIFIDIGDEQSLENDLSTYSSHLTNMKHFVNHAKETSLFLIDEFGTGTEPRLGGAIAEAVLQHLYDQGAFGLINTHYANLKVFADSHPHTINGAMRFDAKKLEPLYLLEIGQAGSSFAFEIAKKIGLPKKILTQAHLNLDDKEIDFDKTLRLLEIEKKKLTSQNQSLHSKEQKYQHLLGKYERLNLQLQNDKKKIINQAKKEAKEILKGVNRQIEETIRQIKEQEADKETTKELRQGLKELDQSLKVDHALILEEEQEEQKEVIEVVGGKISQGDFVRIKGQTAFGQVLSIKGKDAEISIGALKSMVKLNRLEKISHKAFKKEKKEYTRRINMDINEKAAHFSFNIDVRGYRGTEALQELERFIDNAIMVGYQELRIVHGKGDGILKNLIRQQLRQYHQVASFGDEHPDRGGAGVTIVTMK